MFEPYFTNFNYLLKMAEIVEKCPDLPQCYHEEDVIELHPTENISEELIMSNSNLDDSTETKRDSGIEGMFFIAIKFLHLKIIVGLD